MHRAYALAPLQSLVFTTRRGACLRCSSTTTSHFILRRVARFSLRSPFPYASLTLPPNEGRGRKYAIIKHYGNRNPIPSEYAQTDP